jgi:cytochrome P450
MIADRAAPSLPSTVRAETLPGPSPLAAFRYLQSGNFRGGPEWMLATARKYGPIARVKLFGQQIFLVADHELAREVLVTKAKSFAKSRATDRLKAMLGEGLLTSEEPFHLRQRRLEQPAFHRERIAGYGRTMIDLASRWSSGLAEGATVDLASQMMELTMSIATETLFKTDVSAKADAIRSSLAALMSMFPIMMVPFGRYLENVPLPAIKRLRASRDLIDTVVYEMIADRRRDGVDRGDLLSMLMFAKDDDGSQMSDTQVRDEAMTLFLAGHETTGVALTWTWYALSQHPDIERKLYAELAAVLGDRDPEPTDYPQLAYTYAVFKEVLRLYPPAYRMGRRTIETVQIGRYVLPINAAVFVSPFVTQRDPALYADPETFDPERWLGDVEPPKSAFFPFGGGNRMCIGDSFAWMEGVLTIATIARRWRMQRVDSKPLAFNPSVTLRPDGPLRMTMIGR